MGWFQVFLSNTNNLHTSGVVSSIPIEYKQFSNSGMVSSISIEYYLPIAGGRIIGFIPFPRILVLCEMQSVSSAIWTRVVVSIFYEDNHYTTATSKYSYLIRTICTQLDSFKLQIQTIFTQLYSFKYSYLIRTICTQLDSFKYFYLIWTICTQLYRFKYSYLIQIIYTHFYSFRYFYRIIIICTHL